MVAMVSARVAAVVHSRLGWGGGTPTATTSGWGSHIVCGGSIDIATRRRSTSECSTHCRIPSGASCMVDQSEFHAGVFCARMATTEIAIVVTSRIDTAFASTGYSDAAQWAVHAATSFILFSSAHFIH